MRATCRARYILVVLLDKYTDHGTAQLSLDVLKVQPLSAFGTIGEIARIFGGADQLRTAVERLQSLLYAA